MRSPYFTVLQHAAACLAGVALAFGATVGGARADPQFTFDVPVRVQGIMAGIELAVGCDVYNDASKSIRYEGGSTRVPVRDGAYSGTVTHAFNLPPGSSPYDVHHYECRLTLIAQQQACRPVQTTDLPDWCRAVPDTVFVPLVSGPLP